MPVIALNLISQQLQCDVPDVQSNPGLNFFIIQPVPLHHTVHEVILNGNTTQLTKTNYN